MADRHSRDVNRGMRDEAGVGPNPSDARRLVPLKDLGNYKIVDGEPDIRGWNVFASTGRELGVIEELLVDTDLGEVVMVDVDLKRDDRHTTAPIKAAWIDREHRRVVLNTSMFDVDATPRPLLSDRPVETEAHREAAAMDRADAISEGMLQPERRRFVRYGPSHERVIPPPPTEERR